MLCLISVVTFRTQLRAQIVQRIRPIISRAACIAARINVNAGMVEIQFVGLRRLRTLVETGPIGMLVPMRPNGTLRDTDTDDGVLVLSRWASCHTSLRTILSKISWRTNCDTLSAYRVCKGDPIYSL